MSEEPEDPDMKIVEDHCSKLAEHFDSDQVFVTRHEAGEKDGTININWGNGNWFARYGQVLEWCVRRNEDTRCERRNENSD